MIRQGEVLIAILNNQQDFEIVRDQHWYRIPAEQVEGTLQKRWAPEWLAFYQTRVFGSESYAVNYYARVLKIVEVRRSHLFPQEPPNEKSSKRYYKLELSPLERLPQPIRSPKQHRITFISTTFEQLMVAAEIQDLRTL